MMYADNRTLLLAAMCAGIVRWEPFSGDPIRGELCFGGMRYSTSLDAEACPILNEVIRPRLEAECKRPKVKK